MALLTVAILSAQENKNYSFEILEEGFAKSWETFGNGNHLVAVDSEIAQKGTKSMFISSDDATDSFKAISFSIPVNFDGKKMKLTGYIKTENVADHAGLWMRIDPNVAFDNMEDRPVSGTTDWTKYEVELKLNPSKATHVVVGGLLIGTGKMWIDNLEVTVDGKPIEKAAPKKLDKVQSDQEFDKGSGISLQNLNKQEEENATILGKVWGFLKYHHPQIASGNYNWDYELFRYMQPIITSKTSAERDQNLLAWIQKYGKLKPCKKCKETKPNAELKPDHRWITQEGLSIPLQQTLQDIYKNRFQGDQYYIDYANKQVGNPDFKNENDYANMPYPDSGFRLLALYRVWNAVHYFSPNKHITDLDWNDVLNKYVAPFVNAENEVEYEIAALQLIGEMKDTHSNLWGGGDKIKEMKGSLFPPVHVRFIEDQLVVTDFYNPELKASTGLELGDVITSINGKSVSATVLQKLPYYPASNKPSQLRDLAQDILRSNDASIKIEVQRADANKSIELNLYNRDKLNMYSWYPKPKGKSYKMLDGNIGYVTLANITNEDPKAIAKEFIDAKGLILDIRNYPSAFMPFALGQFIAPRGTEFVKFTTMNPDNPGEFNMGSSLMIGAGTIAKKKFEGPVVVLVNELSQSQAEYTAMAFRAAPKTTVIGSTTAGADGNVSNIPIPGGMRTMISGIGVYYPDGSPTQRVGIVPDIEIKPTIKGIAEGRDELMEKAIEIIETKGK